MHSSLLVAVLLAAQPNGTDLTGKVVDSAGKPIANSRVFVYTAGPRHGTSPICPSCYSDCSKNVTTGKSGDFKIESLDSSLIFQILAVADGYRPRIVGKVDPGQGEIKAELEKLPTGLGPKHVLHGRVVDEKGTPIVGAVVEPFGAKTETRQWWGSMPGTDELVVTNEAGEFVITSKEPKLGMELKVNARRHTNCKTEMLATGTEIHEIKMTPGASVAGSLEHKGRPLADVVVGLVQLDRSANSFVGEYKIATDAEGHFQFDNVHPNDKYVLYSKLESLGKTGALEPLYVNVGKDASTSDVGTLKLAPASTITGHIKLTDGKPIPENTKLMLNRDEAWDFASVTLGEDGRFSFDGIPPEPVELTLRIKGYRLASSKNRFQQTSPQSVALFVDKNRDNLEIYLEPEVPSTKRARN